MNKPEYLVQLIDQASKEAGNDATLAKMLEVTPSMISQWRYGKKSCPVADQALMAEVAGLDAAAWHARATVAQYEGTSKGDKLYRALGKALAVTGGALVSSGANAQVIFSTIIEIGYSYFIRCIEVLSGRRPPALI